jgi:hypothetical protein
MLLRHFLAGAVSQGRRELLVLRPLNAVVAPLLLTAATFFAVWFTRPSQGDRSPEPSPRTHRPLRVAASGVVLFLAPFLPFFLIRDEWISTRVTYAPSIGVAFILAGAAELLLMRTRAVRVRRLIRIPLGVAAVGALVAMSLAMLGAQSGFHNRDQLDRTEGANLCAAIGTPAPNSIFVPLRVDSQALRTGSVALDTSFRSPLCIPWSGFWFVRRAYSRRDLEATCCDMGQSAVVGAAPEGLLWDERSVQPTDRRFSALPPNEDGFTVLPWDRVIPVAIAPDSRVLLVTQIDVAGPGGGRVRLPVPQTLAAARVHPELERVAVINRGPRGWVAIRIELPATAP